jgi:hypothetical protein
MIEIIEHPHYAISAMMLLSGGHDRKDKVVGHHTNIGMLGIELTRHNFTGALTDMMILLRID